MKILATLLTLSGTLIASANMHRNSMTPEQRQTMAAAHEKMAICLRSDKKTEDCHKEMMNSCEENMGKGMCSKMWHGKKEKSRDNDD